MTSGQKTEQAIFLQPWSLLWANLETFDPENEIKFVSVGHMVKVKLILA